ETYFFSRVEGKRCAVQHGAGSKIAFHIVRLKHKHLQAGILGHAPREGPPKRRNHPGAGALRAEVFMRLSGRDDAGTVRPKGTIYRDHPITCDEHRPGRWTKVPGG